MSPGSPLMEKLLKTEAPKEAAGCQGSSGFWEEGRLGEGHLCACCGGVVWGECCLEGLQELKLKSTALAAPQS